VDRARIRQLLINLLNNAARFTDEGGVTVSAWSENHDVVVAVADTGSGIDADELSTVFEEFRQVHGPMGRRAGGSGLGLTISKRIAEMHGGAMWVESNLGEGRTFYFTLPVSDNVVSVPLRREWETWAAAPAQPAAARSTLVVWDDSDEPAHLLQRYLDSVDVLSATNVEDVYQIVGEENVAAVVLTGPDPETARERADILRGELKGVTVLVCVLSGRRDIARELGVTDYLVKPIFADQVARVLSQLGLAGDATEDDTAGGATGGATDQDGNLPEILVVDDDPDLVDLLVRMIRTASRRVRVRRAYGGVEGIAAMRERRPAAVFLDLLMPGKDGYSVLADLRADESLRDVPVIVVSARGNREETVSAVGLDVGRRETFSMGETTRLLVAIIEALRSG
jgi:DNA-binding response OmpR family regulator